MPTESENDHKAEMTLRQKTYLLLETGNQSTNLAKFIDWFLIALIAINVAAVIMETVPSVLERHGDSFYWLEVFSVIVFTIEYILRYWSCVENPDYANERSFAVSRTKYSVTPMAIIDLLSILPFYLAFLFSIDLRFLRVLRLLRIFKLTRYSEAMTTLLKVLKDESSSFAATIFIMIVVMIVAASGIYLFEHEVQPDNFGSIPQSMWWSIVTLTTVGYGDVTPLTLAGKFFAACIMVAGVGLVALPTGILASSFSDNLRRGREKMTKELQHALEDGVIDEEEELYLEDMRKKLGLSEENFQEIKQSLLEYLQAGHNETNDICSRCGDELDNQDK